MLVVLSTTGGTSVTLTMNSGDVSTTIPGMGAWAVAQQSNPPSSGQTAVYGFYAVAGQDGSGTITVGRSGTTPPDMQFAVLGITGVDPFGIPEGEAGSAGAVDSQSATLTAAPTVDDITILLATGRNTGASSPPTPGAGFTTVVSGAHSNPAANLLAAYRLNSTSTAVSADGLGTNHGSMVGFVLRVAPAEPSAPVWDAFVWDGTVLQPADVFQWDGSTLLPADVDGLAT